MTERGNQTIGVFIMKVESLFSCPKCGDHKIEEVMKNAKVVVSLKSCNEDGIFQFGQVQLFDGELDYFQCGTCGEELPFKEYDELFESLSNPGPYSRKTKQTH
jgi:predicted RNA-binding Zn-ribbon protein involved in translation (DUF1610 family)